MNTLDKQPSTSSTRHATPNVVQARLSYQMAGRSEEDLLKAHLPLVRSVVDRMKVSLPSRVEVEDLYSVGLIGLVHAARNFDPRHGASFASFAGLRIRWRIDDVISWQAPVVHNG